MIKRFKVDENLKLNREGMIFLLRKLLIVGGITFLFLILATLPQFGHVILGISNPIKMRNQSYINISVKETNPLQHVIPVTKKKFL